MKMRPNKTLLALLFAVSSLLCGRTTQAAEKTAFMLDLASGVAIPIADDNYTKFADPSFKLSLRAGVIFYITRNFGVAPELQFDYIPVNTDDGTFRKTIDVDAKANRIRALAAGRFIIPFGIGSVYFRLGLGVDYITASYTVSGAGLSTSTSRNSTAFTIEPGLGVQFNIAPHIVVGLYAGFPIAPSHDVAVTIGGVDLVPGRFTATDLDLLATIGFRF